MSVAKLVQKICMETEGLDKGIIQVYTGEGKGKTSSALGLALLAVGQGLKVYVAQFLKGRVTGEVLAASRLSPDLTLRTFGRRGFVNARAPTHEDLILAQKGWKVAKAVIEAGKHDLVVLDEINRAIAHALIPLNEVLEALRQRPEGVGVVLTGRQAAPELIAMADQVVEMVPIKHYYTAGVPARRGIEW
jgi:cob(I)alamin adenosyltransferase